MMSAIPKFSVKPGYRPQSLDTSPETDMLTFYLLGTKTESERLRMAASLTRSARKLSLSSLKQSFPHLEPTFFAQKVAFAWLQEYCPPNYIPTVNSSMWIQDSVQLAVKLHPLIEELGIAYYITGGVAAISYGEPRTTQDLDLVMAVKSEDIDRLANTLSNRGFYVPGVDDVKSGRMLSLQVTDIESISRADLIVAQTSEFERLKFARRRVIEFEGTALYFATPEDVILSKLRWRQRSGSFKQWRDVLGVLKVQGENLDYNYLTQWAAQLDIAADLNQALTEAGI